MIDYTLSTQLYNTIENAHNSIPMDAYTLLTDIAKNLNEIVEASNGVQLSAEYTHRLTSMANRDIPNVIDSYISLSKTNSSTIEAGEIILLEGIVAIHEDVENVRNELKEQTLDELRSNSEYLKSKYVKSELTDDPNINNQRASSRAMNELNEGLEEVNQKRSGFFGRLLG